MKSRMFRTLGLVLASLVAASARGALSGTVAAAPGATVTPGQTSDPAGTLLASISAPFTFATGTGSGTLVSAVYLNAGGKLDFYYQVTSNATSTNCGGAGQPVCDSLARLTELNFLGFATALGYRTDGSTLPGGFFVDGSTVPVEADRDSAGTAVGFTFYPGDSAKVHPGQTSRVFVISTDAVSFSAGSVTIVGGGGTTVAAFRPAIATAPPNPAGATGGGR